MSKQITIISGHKYEVSKVPCSGVGCKICGGMFNVVSKKAAQATKPEMHVVFKEVK